jgi:hypothetical protein
VVFCVRGIFSEFAFVAGERLPSHDALESFPDLLTAWIDRRRAAHRADGQRLNRLAGEGRGDANATMGARKLGARRSMAGTHSQVVRVANVQRSS